MCVRVCVCVCVSVTYYLFLLFIADNIYMGLQACLVCSFSHSSVARSIVTYDISLCFDFQHKTIM